MEAIRTEGLSKRFGARTAVDELTLSVHEGELFSLLGQNGAGKTTTIKMLCGLCESTGGDAFMEGHSVRKETEAVKQLLNVSPQETAVAPKLSVRENLELIARIYGADRGEAQTRARSMMDMFELSERSGDAAKKLSGGMQRRLSIAMALISQPRVLFLDEPTLGLDVRARRDLWNTLRALKGKITIILTTHYLEEAEALSDRVGVIEKGRLVALGTVEQIKAQTGTATLEEAFLTLTDEEARI